MQERRLAPPRKRRRVGARTATVARTSKVPTPADFLPMKIFVDAAPAVQSMLQRRFIGGLDITATNVACL